MLHKIAMIMVIVPTLAIVTGCVMMTRAVTLAVIMVVVVGVVALIAGGALFTAEREGGLFRLQWSGSDDSKPFHAGYRR